MNRMQSVFSSQIVKRNFTDFLLMGAAVMFALLCMPGFAYAYVDPSVMTYTIQALAGVAVALSAVAGVAFRRTRKAIFKALKIDENANKVVDPAVHRVPGGSDETALVLLVNAKQMKGTEKGYPTRVLQAFLMVCFLVLTVCIAAPFEIIVGGSTDLSVGLRDVIAPLVFAALALVAIGTIVIPLLKGKAFNVAATAVFALGLCAYVQSLFLNTGLPIADGTVVDWSQFDTMKAISSAVWIALIAGCCMLAVKRPRISDAATTVLALALIIVQGVAVGSLVLKDSQVQHGVTTGAPVLTEEGLFDVAPGNNVVVFILDTLDTAYFEEATAREPEIMDDYTGFTWYDDSAGMLIPTSYALPYLLTGTDPAAYGTKDAYLERRWENTGFLDSVAQAGYSVGVYSDSVQANGGYGVLSSRTVNVHPLDIGDGSSALDARGAVRILYKAALYRDLPWPFKPGLLFSTNDIDNSAFPQLGKTGAAGATVPYTMDDLGYYHKLADGGLKVKDDGGNGTLRVIHLEGPHPPFIINSDLTPAPDGSSTAIDQTIASLKIVGEYIRQMKQLGVYDDATIIVTADHGIWYLTPDLLGKPTSPIMLVKQKTTASQSAQALNTSEAPVSHADIVPTVLQAMGQDYSDFGTPVNEVAVAPRERQYYATLYKTSDRNSGDSDWAQYEIRGNAMDLSNWHFTGNVLVDNRYRRDIPLNDVDHETGEVVRTVIEP